MTTRREMFPWIAGAAGMSVAPVALGAPAAARPELRRVPYRSARTGQERDYFVYLPPGHSTKKQWPVMLFLHGVVQATYFYAVMNELEKHGATDVRLTNEEDLGHFTWVRVYRGQDLYDWFLQHSR